MAQEPISARSGLLSKAMGIWEKEEEFTLNS